MTFEEILGATPIDINESQGLLFDWIRTQAELNAAEQKNIIQAKLWLAEKEASTGLTEAFICELHKRMFQEVWKWAGTFRKSNKNLGVDWPQIAQDLRILLGDVEYWCTNQTYSFDEIGVRYHHRLVSIHCFPNGNGRHARLATDALLIHYQKPSFSWGSATWQQLSSRGDVRKKYIAALREADQFDYTALLNFVRS